MSEHKGLIVEVYRAVGYGDCTNGGVSGKHASLTVVGTKVGGEKTWRPLDKESRVFPPNEDRPAMVLVDYPQVCLVPLEFIENGLPKGHVGPMCGGNYAATSDSRWHQLGRILGAGRINAVPIHDRIESQELYNALSI